MVINDIWWGGGGSVHSVHWPSLHSHTPSHTFSLKPHTSLSFPHSFFPPVTSFFPSTFTFTISAISSHFLCSSIILSLRQNQSIIRPCGFNNFFCYHIIWCTYVQLCNVLFISIYTPGALLPGPDIPDYSGAWMYFQDPLHCQKINRKQIIPTEKCISVDKKYHQ